MTPARLIPKTPRYRENPDAAHRPQHPPTTPGDGPMTHT